MKNITTDFFHKCPMTYWKRISFACSSQFRSKFYNIEQFTALYLRMEKSFAVAILYQSCKVIGIPAGNIYYVS